MKHASEPKLRRRITPLGQWPPQARRGRVVGSLICSDSVLVRPGARRASHGKREEDRDEKRSCVAHAWNQKPPCGDRMAKSKVWEPILSRPCLHRAKPLKQLLAI